MTRASLTVLLSAQEPGDAQNPYIRLLAESARAKDVEIHYFSWQRALVGRVDVFHLHWPETLTRGASKSRSILKRMLTVMLVARLWAKRSRVIRTVHNASPHEPADLLERLIFRAFDRLTGVRIHMVAPEGGGRLSDVQIPHGHYRSSYPSTREVTPDPNCVAFVGAVRPYKGVEELIAAFRDVPDASIRLVIAGRPSSDQYADVIAELARPDERVELRLRAQSPHELSRILGRATLVGLPFRDYLNSGSALLSLSLGRPVLLPDNPSSRQLRAEVGDNWVSLFEGQLNGADLMSALRRARILWQARAVSPPDLSARDWPRIGEAHRNVYTSVAGWRG